MVFFFLGCMICGSFFFFVTKSLGEGKATPTQARYMIYHRSFYQNL